MKAMNKQMNKTGYSPDIRLPCADASATNTEIHTATVIVTYSLRVSFIMKKLKSYGIKT